MGSTQSAISRGRKPAELLGQDLEAQHQIIRHFQPLFGDDGQIEAQPMEHDRRHLSRPDIASSPDYSRALALARVPVRRCGATRSRRRTWRARLTAAKTEALWNGRDRIQEGSVVRDLAEFGKPNAVINTAKISFVSIRDEEQEWPDKTKTTRVVYVVCDGAALPLHFLEGEEDKASAFFDFCKSEIYKSGS